MLKMPDLGIINNHFTAMVTTSGLVPARFNAEYIIRLCKSIKAEEIIVVHIRDQGESREGGDSALDIYSQYAQKYDIPIKKIPAIGDVSQTITELGNFHKVDLIIMGASEGKNIASWIIEKILKNTEIPVVVVPWRFDQAILESKDISLSDSVKKAL